MTFPRPFLFAIALFVFGHAATGQMAERPRVGLALGGGSARGFAHVGVLRWFEEHRIPVDFIAGTSMGGLIGGAYASGMSASELTELIESTNWDRLFGLSSFSYRSMQRKEDARAYPSRLELHIRRGPGLPAALNNGQQVDLLLQRIAGVYGTVSSFDSLPTPFRTVALDLRTGSTIILDSGSLSRAMRATMSLPGVFPPAEIDSLVLVDGGAMNNLPADVVRKLGADVVIAVKVGSIVDTVAVDYSLLGVTQQTVDAMMRANTRRAMASADLVINAAIDYGGMDWRLAHELIEDGYRAADALKDKLLPYAVSEHAWRRLQNARAAKRVTAVPVIAGIEVVGATAHDQRIIAKRLERHVGRPLDFAALETDFTRFSGMDRYVTVGWRLVQRANAPTLLVEVVPNRSAPPFLMVSLNAFNRTRDDYSFQIASRYVTYDIAGTNSELRVDLALGSDRSIAAELRKPFGPGGLFGAGTLAAAKRRLSFIDDDVIVAQYGETHAFAELEAGWSLSSDAEIRGGLRFGHYDAEIKAGNPDLPEVSGYASELRLRAGYDGQDAPIVPTKGTRLIFSTRYVLGAPALPASFISDRTNENLVQAELHGSRFWSWQQNERRLFAVWQFGTSFGAEPLPSDQFELGHSMRLDAFSPGEARGDNVAVGSIGYLHSLARLPDFMGGPIFAGLWLQNGSAFHTLEDAQFDTQLGLGLIIETLVGSSMVSYSFGPGASRFTVSIGRIFR